jgi:hypothetical protein
MLLLTFLRLCIGEFDTWPSNIFHLLVCTRPTAATIREVAAFFYGNGLPLCYASFFYLTCNEQASFLTTQIMFTIYSLWYSDKTTCHHARYYNVKHKTFMWINGSDHPQMEPVSPERSDMLGVNETERPDMIHGILESLRDTEIEFELLH